MRKWWFQGEKGRATSCLGPAAPGSFGPRESGCLFWTFPAPVARKMRNSHQLLRLGPLAFPFTLGLADGAARWSSLHPHRACRDPCQRSSPQMKNWCSNSFWKESSWCPCSGSWWSLPQWSYPPTTSDKRSEGLLLCYGSEWSKAPTNQPVSQARR